MVILGFACALLAPAAALAHGPGLDPALLGSTGPSADSAVALTRPADCPASADPAVFADSGRMLELNGVMSDFGPRPTASRAHTRFIDWIERRVSGLSGIELDSLDHSLDRWSERRSRIHVLDGSRRGTPLRTSSAVPYSQATGPDGVTAPLVRVRAETQIAEADVAGKIVIRDVPSSVVPNAVFTALSWWSYDPDLTLTKTIADSYEREWLSGQRQIDLRDAADAGAAAVIFVHGFPREQVAGQYAPYDGIRWGVPSVYVGADEGAALDDAAAAGRSARLELRATQAPAATRTLIATLPGVSEERIVVTSHTDGINAVWDNGPISMLAMAEHFASLPRECRPRTLQFVFTTGHLFQALGGPGTHDGSARMIAEQLDAEYDSGTVAAVLAVEHMGARNYEPVPREDGPGRTLVPTGLNEPNSFFIGESPALSAAVLESVVADDLRGTIALRGADLPGVRIPPHRSFGGEGGPYHQRLVPTIAFVTGPWTLFNPAFGLEAIDPALLRHQTLVFADIVHNLETVPREALGGGYLAYRQARSIFCSSGLGAFGLAECPGAAKPAGLVR